MTRFLVKAILFVSALDLLVLGSLMCHGSAFGDGDPFSGQYWEAARDGHLLFCAEEGVDPDWVERTLERDWGLWLTHECAEPDLIIRAATGLTHPDIGMACGLAYVGQLCILEINEICLAGGPFYQANNNVAEIVLDHEVGHCLGFDHRDHGVMYYQAIYLPTEEDVALVRERYGLDTGLIPVPASGKWVLARWASQPTVVGALADDVLAAYAWRDGAWLRYFPDAPAEVNTLTELRRDQPVFVLGR